MGDVEGGVLLGVGGCDDGHQVVAVGWVELGEGGREGGGGGREEGE